MVTTKVVQTGIVVFWTLASFSDSFASSSNSEGRV